MITFELLFQMQVFKDSPFFAAVPDDNALSNSNLFVFRKSSESLSIF